LGIEVVDKALRFIGCHLHADSGRAGTHSNCSVSATHTIFLSRERERVRMRAKSVRTTLTSILSLPREGEEIK
jgi:hypothetical protein